METYTMVDKKHEVARNLRLSGSPDLSQKATGDISAALRRLLADVFALYLKTKNFHWHMSASIFGTIACCPMSTATSSLQ
jgi:hypothetical protein